MNKADYYIQQLGLIAHPEGGFFKETYRCSQEIEVEGFNGKRNVSTAIYFLLKDEHKSHFHRIKSDELWFHHDGVCLEVLVLDENGLTIHKLGKDIANGESLQLTVPANTWFASRVKDYKGFALVSCTVAPGFSFEDFELANKEDILNQYPDYKEVVEEMVIG